MVDIIGNLFGDEEEEAFETSEQAAAAQANAP